MTFDERYRAVSSRDRRFDGQFVTAVTSTGIYCRPSCPARTPLRKNVTFFPTSAAAHAAGYRACKRCLPEASPGSPRWNLQSDVASRAMRLIALGVVDRGGVGALAHTLGYSTRQLGRILQAELGASPLALARAHRAATARMLLVSTSMSVTDVAFAAGFQSVRQFSDTIAEVYGMSARDLRRRSPQTSGAAAMRLRLPARSPADFVGAVQWWQAHAIDGCERAGSGSFARVMRLAGGLAAFRAEAGAGTLDVEVEVTDIRDLGALIARIRRMFDLDADPVAIDGTLSSIPELAESVRRVPGIRLPGAADPGEMLIRTMMSQQISLRAARTHQAKLVAGLGEPATMLGQTWATFPSMAAIAERGASVLSGPRRRVDAIVTAANRIAEGLLAVTDGDDPVEQHDRLTALPGIGAWTADVMRMRVLGDPDTLLTSDLAVRSGAADLGLPSDAEGLRARLADVSPWRSYATMHLWRTVLDRGKAKP